jgi:hypothetical protein
MNASFYFPAQKLAPKLAGQKLAENWRGSGQEGASMFALITGTLHRNPVARIGKTGAPFVTAHLRYRAGLECGWASVIAFAEDARAELLRLHEDDVVTVQGEARLATYTGKGGDVRPSSK